MQMMCQNMRPFIDDQFKNTGMHQEKRKRSLNTKYPPPQFVDGQVPIHVIFIAALNP